MFIGRWIIWAKSCTRGYPTHLSMTSLSLLILLSHTGSVSLGSVCSHWNSLPCIPCVSGKLSQHTATGHGMGTVGQGGMQPPTVGISLSVWQGLCAHARHSERQNEKDRWWRCSSAPQHVGLVFFKLKDGLVKTDFSSCLLYWAFTLNPPQIPDLERSQVPAACVQPVSANYYKPFSKENLPFHPTTTHTNQCPLPCWGKELTLFPAVPPPEQWGKMTQFGDPAVPCSVWAGALGFIRASCKSCTKLGGVKFSAPTTCCNELF